MFDVTVKTLDGRDSSFSVEDELTVVDFKRKIESTLDIPVSQQRLIFQGRALQDEKSLMECGVKDRVVHLVRRPPPSTQQEDETPVSEDSNPTPSPGIVFQWSNDARIRPHGSAAEIMRRNPELFSEGAHGAMRFSLFDLRECYRTFTRFYNRAAQILARLDRNASSGEENTASTAINNDLPQDGTDGFETFCHWNETVSTVEETIGNGENRESPMHVDSEGIDDNSRKSGGADTETGNLNVEHDRLHSRSRHLAKMRSISNLPAMLSCQRRQWQTAQPYLERWESMLMNESRLQHELNSSYTQADVNSANADTGVMISDVSMSTENADAPMPTSSKQTERKNVGSVPTTHQLDQDFINQMSEFLHIQGHMLHLLSECSIVPRTPSPLNQSTQVVTENTSVAQTLNSDTGNDAQTAESSCTGTVHSQRCLHVTPPDYPACLMFNDMPVDSTDRTRPSTPLQSRRSASASGIRSHRIGEPRQPPVVTTVSASPTVNISAVPNASVTHGSLPHGSAFIHRVDIPIISMNMFNMPPQVVSSRSAFPTTITSSTFSVGTPVVNTSGRLPTVPTWSTASQGQVPLNIRNQINAHIAGPPNQADPFLLCQSRHSHGFLASRIDGGGARMGVSAPFPGFPSMPPFQFNFPASGLATESTPMSTSNSTTTTNTTGTTTASQERTGSQLPPSLRSILSASLNAIAPLAGSFGTLPRGFDVFLQGTPMEFMVNMNPNPTTTTTTVASATVPHTVSSFSRNDVPPTRQESSAQGAGSESESLDETSVPSWSTAVEPNEYSKFITDFIDAAVDTVWSCIQQFAGLGQYRNNVAMQSSGSSDLPFGEIADRFSVGFVNELSRLSFNALTACSNQSLLDSPEVFQAECLDDLWSKFRRILRHADRALQKAKPGSTLSDAVVDLLFARNCYNTTDFLSLIDKEGLNRTNEQAGDRTTITDVRASLMKILKALLKSQLELWRSSPTKVGFGSLFISMLDENVVDFICMLDVIIRSVTSVPTALSGSWPKVGNVFLERMEHYLMSESVSSVNTLVLRGVRHCANRWASLDESDLEMRRNRLKETFLILEQTSSGSGLQMNASDDTDTDDAFFVDAISQEDLQTNESHVTTTKSSSDTISVSHPLLFSEPPRTVVSSGKLSPLPEWVPRPGDVPEAWSDGLNPHPDSARSLSDSGVNVEGWHGLLPAEWANIIAGDVVHMTEDRKNGNFMQSDHFSDAYIAGMPAKRRKVIEAQSEATHQSLKSLFTNCLSDAMDASGCDAAQLQQLPASDDSSENVNREQSDLLSSLRNVVSERISDRLTNDPDFDPLQFPLSNDLFVQNLHK